MTDNQNQRWQVASLFIIFLSATSAVAFVAGRTSTPPLAPPAPAPIVTEVVVEPDPLTLVALKERQAAVEDLTAQLQSREAELEAVRRSGRAAGAAQRSRIAELESEVELLRGQLVVVEAERDTLRGELTQALAELDTQIAENKRVRQRARVYKRASTHNLWSAFVSDAKVQICDKGSRKAHGRCHAAVDTFFDEASLARFSACVDTQQAVPVLQKAGRGQAQPAGSVALPEDNRFTRKGWHVLYCDPTLPEAVAADDINVEPALFARRP